MPQLFNSSEVGRVSFLLKCIHTHASCQIGITLKGLGRAAAAAVMGAGMGEARTTPSCAAQDSKGGPLS